MSFANLKKNRKNQLSKLVSEAEKLTKRKSFDDDRMWKPTVDKAGNGYAVIRFLPAKGDGTPWVRFLDYGFQGPTGLWYIEKSLNTIDKPDPVSEYYFKTKAVNEDAVKDIKLRKNFVANVYVVSDPSNPQNEGKVMLYKFGAKIFSKIMDAMEPEFEDEQAVNVFDFWEGANFKIKIRKVEGWPNYDKSEFESVSALEDGDDEKLEAIYNQMYDLGEFVDPESFKSYDELKAKLERVLCLNADGPTEKERARAGLDDEDDEPTNRPSRNASSIDLDEDDGDDDSLSFFKSLAEED